MIRYLLTLLFVCLVTGCTSFDDVAWEVRPGESTDSIAVETAPGDMVCVRDPDNGERHCVPSLKKSEE